MAPMYERVIKVISKPPTRRTTVEIKMLLPWFRNRSEMMANVENDVLVDLLRHCKYVKVPADDLIIRQGDIGNSFYIMLTGSTSVYIDPNKTDEGPTSQGPLDNNPLESGQSKSIPSTVDKERDSQGDMDKETADGEAHLLSEKLDRSTLGNFIVKFGAGDDGEGAGKTFGDLALMSENAERNASIVAEEETDLLCINRDLFNRSLKLKQEQEYEDRRVFIENCPLFRKWNPKFRRLLEMSMRKDVFPFGSTMVRQGDTVQGLHLIVTGQAQVTVRPSQHKQQYPKYFEPPSSAISRELGKSDGRGKLPDLSTEGAPASEQPETRNHQRRDDKVKQSIQKTQIRVRRKQGYAAAERRLADQSVTVSCLNKNEVIGDVEIILGLDTYTNTVVCTAKTEAFLLDVKNLERLVYKKNMATMNSLTQTVENKLCSRMRSPQVGQHVPLYTHLYDKVLELKPTPQPPPSRDITHTREAGGSAGQLRDPTGTKDQCMAQLVKLFLQDRAPLIPPAVPGSLYYLAKSLQRAEQEKFNAKRKADENALSANVRLERARKYSRRKPLSRRELERMCAGEPIDYVKQYSHNKEHAIGRILNLHPASARQGDPRTSVVSFRGKTRPHTAIGGRTTRTDVVADVTTSTPLPRPTRVDVETAVGDLFDMNDLPDEPAQQQFDADDLDEEMLRQVMADMGGYQQGRQKARAKIICSMLEKKATQSPMRNLLRPKSAPSSAGDCVDDDDDEGEEEDEHFDWDTSEPALRTLEEKIKGFLDKYERISPGIVEPDPNELLVRKAAATVSVLKRFVVEGPDDIPIPGGTVYVRQKVCKNPIGPSHQHVRRYMIPKNAYALATKSLAEISRPRTATNAPSSSGTRPGSAAGGRGATAKGAALRPTTAPARARGRMSSLSTHSAWG